jgi:hypothetical protein
MRSPSPAHRADHNRELRPAWRCGVCHELLNVMANDGSIYFSYSEWWAYRDAEKAWNEAHPELIHSLAEYAEYPELRWHVVHDRCDRAAIDRYDVYWLDVNRMDTWAKVAEWSAHLSGKQWFADTDWSGLLYGAGVAAVEA